MVGRLLAGLVGVGGCGGLKSSLERVMVLGMGGAWLLRVVCFRTGGCHCYWAACFSAATAAALLDIAMLYTQNTESKCYCRKKRALREFSKLISYAYVSPRL
jgi:hypothetical protein